MFQAPPFGMHFSSAGLSQKSLHSSLLSLQSGTAWLEGTVFLPLCFCSSWQKEAGVSFLPPTYVLLCIPEPIFDPSLSPIRCPETTSQVCRRGELSIESMASSSCGPSAIFGGACLHLFPNPSQRIKMKAGAWVKKTGSGQSSSKEDKKYRVSLCDVFSEEFKKTQANT